MKEKEIQLITSLRENGRATLTEISKNTQIPVSTLFDILKRSRTIRKHTCLPDFQALGYQIKAIFLVGVSSDQKEPLRKELLKRPHLNNLLKINNGYDFLFELIAHDLNTMEQLREDLEGQFSFSKKEVHYVIDEVARECFLSSMKQAKLFKLI